MQDLTKITGHLIINMGQDDSQHFPGATAMFQIGGVQYNEVFTGVGDNSKEAYEDALNRIAEADIYAPYDFPKRPATISKADKVSAKDLRESDGSWQCYVAVYIKF